MFFKPKIMCIHSPAIALYSNFELRSKSEYHNKGGSPAREPSAEVKTV